MRIQQYFWSFVVILASTRGAFVFHLGLPPNLTYQLTSVLLILFGLLAFHSMLINRGVKSFVLLRNLIIINFIFIGIISTIYLINGGLENVSLFYLFSVFPIIFILLNYDERLLTSIVWVIALVTSFGVIYFYNIGISGGFEAIKAAHHILRPDKFAYSRIGDKLLPFGYQGNHHDAANILVICSSFFLIKLIIDSGFKKNLLYLAALCLTIFSVLLTGSAANTLVLFFVSSITLIFSFKFNLYLISFIICFAPFFVLNWNLFADYFYFFEKIRGHSQLENDGMFNSLDIESILSSAISVLMGFGSILEVPMIHSEVAFIKLLVGLGFMPFSVLMLIVFSPLYYVVISRRVNKAPDQLIIPYNSSEILHFKSIRRVCQKRLILSSMPVLTATLTLLHYGSFFRVTSIGLVCVLMALYFKEYLRAQKCRYFQI